VASPSWPMAKFGYKLPKKKPWLGGGRFCRFKLRYYFITLEVIFMNVSKIKKLKP
jgi:hypothetical protein